MTNIVTVIASVLIAEAGGESHRDAMAAVAAVIQRRATTQRMTPIRVVTMPKHFAWLPSQLDKHRRHPRWPQATQLAQRVVQGRLDKDPTNGATHFSSGPTPWWARGQKPVAVIGNHKYWRLN